MEVPPATSELTIAANKLTAELLDHKHFGLRGPQAIQEPERSDSWISCTKSCQKITLVVSAVFGVLTFVGARKLGAGKIASGAVAVVVMSPSLCLSCCGFCAQICLEGEQQQESFQHHREVNVWLRAVAAVTGNGTFQTFFKDELTTIESLKEKLGDNASWCDDFAQMVTHLNAWKKTHSETTYQDEDQEQVAIAILTRLTIHASTLAGLIQTLPLKKGEQEDVPEQGKTQDLMAHLTSQVGHLMPKLQWPKLALEKARFAALENVLLGTTPDCHELPKSELDDIKAKSIATLQSEVWSWPTDFTTEVQEDVVEETTDPESDGGDDRV